MGFRPSGRDHLFFSGAYFGVVAVALMALMPLRMSERDELANFPQRTYSMSGMTGRDEQMHSWKYWDYETCESYKIAATELFRADTAAISEAIEGEQIEGVIQPCSAQHGCRDHTAVRCYWYESMKSAGTHCLMYHVLGLVFYIGAIVGVVTRVNLKVAVLSGMFGGLIQLLACLYWALVSDGMQNAIRTQSFWPYANLTGPFKACCALCVIQMVMAATGVSLQKHTGKGAKPLAEEDEGADDGSDQGRTDY